MQICVVAAPWAVARPTTVGAVTIVAATRLPPPPGALCVLCFPSMPGTGQNELEGDTLFYNELCGV